MLYIPHTTEQYSVTKRNEELTHITTQTLETLCSVEEVGLKGPHPVQPHRYEMSRTGKSQRQNTGCRLDAGARAATDSQIQPGAMGIFWNLG